MSGGTSTSLEKTALRIPALLFCYASRASGCCSGKQGTDATDTGNEPTGNASDTPADDPVGDPSDDVKSW